MAFFWFKSIIVLPSIWGLFIFCMVNTKGNVGSVYTTRINGNHGWFIMYAINSGMGNTATLITNQPDIARWSKTKTGSQWSQLITNPLAATLSASLWILATAAINNTWGLDLWNPWDLGAILDRYWSATTRFAVFLSAFTLLVSILGTNIAANMIPFGSDSSMLFPRYINIPRGQFIVEFPTFVICPWKLFTTFCLDMDSSWQVLSPSWFVIVRTLCLFSKSLKTPPAFLASEFVYFKVLVDVLQQIIFSPRAMCSLNTSITAQRKTNTATTTEDGTFKPLLHIYAALSRRSLDSLVPSVPALRPEQWISGVSAGCCHSSSALSCIISSVLSGLHTIRGSSRRWA